ncbi:MAG TPA: hypothetical protein VGM74_12280 [Burkholderiaceae bacterium]
MPPPRSQRGAAALLATLMLFLAMALGALALKRSLGIEQHHASAQLRATQAFEAAEAGLAWAQVQLNSPQAIDARCEPSAQPSAVPFRTRALDIDATSGAVVIHPLQAACLRGAAGWSCSCVAAGPLVLPAPDDDAVAPAFGVSLLAGGAPGRIRLVAQGCSPLGSACAPGSTATAEATATTSVTLALFGSLRTPPSTALTSRDATQQTEDQFFAGFFGLDKATWRDQTVVAGVACHADCGGALTEATARGQSLVAVDGDVSLRGPLTLGSAAHPVALVVEGALRLDGPVAIVGVVYANAIMIGAPGATVLGAALTEGGYAGPSAPGFRLDAGVLAVLRQQAGSFVRVDGSWRDF